MANSGNDLQVSQLLAYNADSQLIFFVGQSLSRVDGETVVTEQDMRSNIFIFSVHHGTTQCLTCRLVGCHRKRSSPLSSKQKGLSCLGN